LCRLVYLSSARQDFRDILRYITVESGNRSVGRAFVDRLQQQCRKLASLPGTMGRARPELRPDIRSAAFRGYVIFFRCDAETFEVVNVLEGHRDIDSYFEDTGTAN
jgi:plasmid stabilization system protein ParE